MTLASSELTGKQRHCSFQCRHLTIRSRDEPIIMSIVVSGKKIKENHCNFSKRQKSPLARLNSSHFESLSKIHQ